MSRRDVRIALCRYLSGADNPEPSDLHAWRGTAITGLGVMYDAPPGEWPRDWAVPLNAVPGEPFGAMCSVRFSRSEETRVAGSRGVGIKRDAWNVALDIWATCATEVVGDAVDGAEALYDSLTARLRSDPTLGGTVFSAGEGDISNKAGATSSIAWDYGFPAINGGITTIWAACTFGVVQQITG